MKSKTNNDEAIAPQNNIIPFTAADGTNNEHTTATNELAAFKAKLIQSMIEDDIVPPVFSGGHRRSEGVAAALSRDALKSVAVANSGRKKTPQPLPGVPLPDGMTVETELMPSEYNMVKVSTANPTFADGVCFLSRGGKLITSANFEPDKHDKPSTWAARLFVEKDICAAIRETDNDVVLAWMPLQLNSPQP